jgi:hypothetical protein
MKQQTPRRIGIDKSSKCVLQSAAHASDCIAIEAGQLR